MDTQYIRAAQDIVAQGYGRLTIDDDLDPTGLFREKIKVIVEMFQNFNIQQIEYRKRFTFDLSENGKPGTGYFRRDDQEHKNVMDYQMILPALLQYRNIEFRNSHDLLIRYIEENHILLYKIMGRFLERGIENVLPKYKFLERFKNISSRHAHVSRFLQYDPVTVTKETIAATAHTDQSMFTIPFFSSHKGLWLHNEKNFVPETRENELIIFASRKAQVITGGTQYYETCGNEMIPCVRGGKIKAVTHGVVLLPEMYGVEYQRNSGVYFAHDADTKLLPKKYK